MGRERRPGEALEAFVERQIREAQAAGELDDVVGKGEPLPFVDKPHDPMAAPTTLAPLDVEAVLARWRAARGR